jgi:hypothetical protein
MRAWRFYQRLRLAASIRPTAASPLSRAFFPANGWWAPPPPTSAIRVLAAQMSAGVARSTALEIVTQHVELPRLAMAPEPDVELMVADTKVYHGQIGLRTGSCTKVKTEPGRWRQDIEPGRSFRRAAG